MSTSHLFYALLGVSILLFIYRPVLAFDCHSILSYPLSAVRYASRVLVRLEDYWIGAPGHMRPWLYRTKWRPRPENGQGHGSPSLLELDHFYDADLQGKPDKRTRRLVLVTGADGGVGFETTIALLLVNCDVLMGIKDMDLPGYWTRIQQRIHSRIQAELALDASKSNSRSSIDATGRVDSACNTLSNDHIGRPLPFKCDFSQLAGARAAAQEVWNLVNKRFTSNDDHGDDDSPDKPEVVGTISHYIGTVGIGTDRPSASGVFASRYTETDDGLEWQLAINAVNPFLFNLLVWPLIVRATDNLDTTTTTTEQDPRHSIDGRILLTNSVAHAWNSLPLAIPPSYQSWEVVKAQSERRWAAGRYNFSKLTQLLLHTSLHDLSPSLLSALSHLLSRDPSDPSIRRVSPTLLALHPGEVNTPFLDLMLPTWRLKWIEDLTCLTPEQGAWTGLWGCVVDVSKRARASRTRSKGRSASEQGEGKEMDVDVDVDVDRRDVGYHYLHSLCTFGKPASPARDGALVEACRSLVGDWLATFLLDVGKEDDSENCPAGREESGSLSLGTWERKVGQVLAGSLR